MRYKSALNCIGVGGLLAVVFASFLFSLGPTSAANADERVDASTLTGKLIAGYQGWFACPGDGARLGWGHWRVDAHLTVDSLPDMTDFPASERCATDLKTADGQTIYLFSSYNAATLEHHFAWMEQYGIDGVALQRFATGLMNPQVLEARDVQLTRLTKAAEDHGRIFFIMYDLSGLSSDKASVVVEDWSRLEQRGVTRSAAYARHRGHPLLALWGLSFPNQVPIEPVDAARLIDSLNQASSAFGGITIFAGVPSYWRTHDHDASRNKAWDAVWRRVGVISPWSVGRYTDAGSVDVYRRDVTQKDLDATRQMGIDYMPVVYPGFSFANTSHAMHSAPPSKSNQIPRNCGHFFWNQVHSALEAGASMLYIAMFDELNEGTAILKMLPTAPSAPITGLPSEDTFVMLDADGCKLPSDWYLRLAGAASTALHRGQRPTSELPLSLKP